MPVLRVGDTTACGDSVTEGIGNILINGKPIAFLGSATAHGGMIITGSGDVFVGTAVGAAPFTPIVTVPKHSERFQLVDETTGEAIPDMLYCIETGDGQRLVGHTDNHGNAAQCSPPILLPLSCNGARKPPLTWMRWALLTKEGQTWRHRRKTGSDKRSARHDAGEGDT